MRRTTLARWLVVGALAGFGLLTGAEVASAQTPEPTPTPTPAATTAAATPAPTAAASSQGESTVQGSNSATNAQAGSSNATATNSANAGAGPQATSGRGGQTSQIGNNNVTVNQSSSAKTGDSVAGSQVVGVVGGSATIQGQNSSRGATAVSGAATATNSATVNAGPVATGGRGASAQQIGDNNVEVNQVAIAETGSAVAGSQVTGIVGLGGDSVVQNQNSSVGAVARSGDATARNRANVNAGPLANATGGRASAAQIGDNDAVLSQSSVARSGDAVAGSQVTGIVGDGDATVQGQNSSRNPLARSGDATATNAATLNAGPLARSTAIGANAQTSQIGDNTVEVRQRATSETGDAVAGGQVTGLVSQERGHLTIQNQQSSDAPIARSGDAVATNRLTADAGATALSRGRLAQASQNGDNDVTVRQTADAETGDAVAGGQVIGAVGGDDVTVQTQNDSRNARANSGDVFARNNADVNAGALAQAAGGRAQVSQIGDNAVDVRQVASGESGDAVAGSTVIGIVADGDVTIQAQNSARNPIARSGDVFARNRADVQSGPVARAAGRPAMASQIGDNFADVRQVAVGESGDAVAGSQVFGVVADGDVTIQAQNDSRNARAASGDVFARNVADVNAGPVARTLGTGRASVQQIGDNVAVLDQEAIASSGDAVAGSQVVGVVNRGGETTIQLQNSSRNSVARTGDAFAVNRGTLNAGPLARAASGSVSVSQIGDNFAELTQSVEASTGDAVSGSQVVGAVGGSDLTVQHSNSSTNDVAVSANAFGLNAAFGGVGPVGFGPGIVNVSQNGDNEGVLDQALVSESGDAVAGSGVIGDV